MPAKDKGVGVLFSGGLDSAALIGQMIDAGHIVWPVYIACGLPWEKAEKHWANQFLKSVSSPRLKPLITVRLFLDGAYKKNWSHTGATPDASSTDSDVFLPARNLLLIIKALLGLSSRNIFDLAIGTLNGNPFPDGKHTYFKSLENLLTQSFQRRIRIHAPLRERTKVDVLRSNRKRPLWLSFSCISPKGNIHCGTCNKCAERRLAFKKAALDDKTVYKRTIHV